MKIKTKLQLIIIVNVLMLSGIISLNLLWQKQAERLSEREDLITELNLSIFEQARFREEYFIYGSDRSKEQFMLTHKEIGGHLERMAVTFNDPEERAYLNNMAGAHKKIGALFNRLVRLDESATVHAASTQASRERIISQMLVNARSMFQDGVKLLKEANKKTAYQNNLVRLFSYIAFGLLALFIGSFAAIIIRNITFPLSRLHEGTEIIAEGNLGYKTNIRTRDEIGQLSNAFDNMTESLQKITVSRDKLGKEIETRKKTEEALRESEEKYRWVLDNMADVITVMDMNLRFTYVSPSIMRMRGYTAEEAVAQTFEQVMTPESLLISAKVFEEEMKLEASGAADPGRIRIVETEQYRKDGSIVLMENSLSFMRDTAQKPVGMISVSRDITERKRAEEKLRESEELFRSYLENAPDGVYMSDLEGNFLYGNRKCEEIIGYRKEELIGKNFLELNILPENSLDKAAQLLQANMEGKSTGPDEIDLISKEGRLKPVEINTSVVQRMGQRTVLAFVRDITERKRAEEALRESESLSRSLIDYMHDAMIILDWDGSILFTNRAAARIIEFERPEELIGHNMVEYLHPDSLQKAAEDIEAVKAGKMGFLSEYRLCSVTGRHIWVESIGGKIIFRNASANLACIRDITERKLAEEQLRQTLESLRKAFGAIIQVMVSAVEVRDPYTSGHQIRSANLARCIATEMGLPQEKIEGIRMAGSIHDIGKLSIPAEILSKPTKLSEIEFSLIKEHALRGFEMMKDVESPWPLAEIVYQHHERMDGSGYPRQLKGEEILMEARILAVADVVESMASHRPYRPARGIDLALEEIEKNKGTHYDNTVADACLRLFREKGFQLEGT